MNLISSHPSDILVPKLLQMLIQKDVKDMKDVALVVFYLEYWLCLYVLLFATSFNILTSLHALLFQSVTQEEVAGAVSI